MKLVIAEKMSVALNIAKALGVTDKKHGYMEDSRYIITWCIGHLAGLADAAAYDVRYAKWRYEDLPIIPNKWIFSVNEGKGKQYGIVTNLMKRRDVTEIVNACDAGREGELIFRFIYELSGCNKPFKRLWISSMEESAIRDGFDNLIDGHEFDNLYESALCRAKADWIIGINATRLFSSLYKKHLNIGRVQSPTLALLAERDTKISMFKKEKYYTVRINDTNFSAVSERITDFDEAKQLQIACHNGQAICTSVNREKKAVNPPKLYDLTTLQREANRIFGYTAKQTLDYAQSLYEHKYLTYPRTDSQYLTEDMANTANMVVHLSAKHPPFSNCSDFYPSVALVINSAKVTDHHAIIPTAEIENIKLSELPKGEANILQLVMCKLLCAVHEAHIYETVTAEFDCDGTIFKARGRNVVSEGWKEIEHLFKLYSHTADNTAEDNIIDVEEGGIYTVSSELKEGFTTPPKHFTEDTLLSAMETAGAAETTDEAERKGLGTPATRAGIIEKLVQTGFVERNNRSVVATKDGVNLVTVLPDILKSPQLTSDWENQLAEISKGTYPPERFMSGIVDLTRELVKSYSFITDEQKEIFRKDREVIGKCPRCNSDVYESKQNFYCSNKRCKFALWKNDKFFTDRHKELTKQMAVDFLAKGKTKVKDMYSIKTGKTYNATVVMSDGEKYVNYKLEFDKPKQSKGGKR